MTDPALLRSRCCYRSRAVRYTCRAAGPRPFTESPPNEEIRSFLGFDQPLALLQVGTLHHYTADNGAELMHEYIEALPSGSFVVIAHFFNLETRDLTELAQKMEELFVFVHSPMGSGRFRTAAQILSFVDGLEFVRPARTKRPGWPCATTGGPTDPSSPTQPGRTVHRRRRRPQALDSIRASRRTVADSVR